MKTKFIHVGKRTLSVVLSIMMIVSTMLIGTISSVSAANVTATVYIDCTNMPELGSSSNKPNIYAWHNDGRMSDEWPGTAMSPVNGSDTIFYYDLKFDTNSVDTDSNPVKLIFNKGDKQTQTGDIIVKDVAGSDWITNPKIFIVNSSLDSSSKYKGEWKNYQNTVTYGAGTGMDSFGSVTATDSSSNTVPSDTKVDYKTSVTFKATANTDYEFKGWYSTDACTGNPVSTNDEYTVSVADDTTLYAKFVKVNYVYVKNKKQWSSVNAYFWNESGPVGAAHPGTKMTPVATNESIYKIAVPDGATKVKFNDGTTTNQSSNFELSTNLNKIYNNSSGYWFSFDTTAKYTINGPIVGTSYEDWEATSSVSNEFDVYGTHYLDVELTDTAKGYFRIKYNTNSFGPARENDTTTGDEDVKNNITPATAYEAHPTYNGKAFKISETGIYRIYVRDAYDANNRPDVWVVKTGGVSVTDPTITFGVNGLNGQLTATSGGNSISSGDTVTSGSSVTFTASPTDSTYTVEGWYSNADCTSDSKISDAGTSTSYTISDVTSDKTVYVKFKSSSEPVGNAPVLHQYELASGDGGTIETSYSPILSGEMIYHSDSRFTYYYYEITNGGQYLYNITLNDETYYKGNTTTYDNSVYISNSYGRWTDTFETGYEIKHYYIIYTPSLDDDQRISVVTTLPGSTPPTPAPDTYTVTMEQGISTPRTTNGTTKAMGSSYLDNVNTQTAVTKSIKDLTVTFTTQTTDVSADETTLGYTGKYMYQVYGYSINMNLDNGDSTTSTRVASVVNSLVDSNSAKPISALANGIYTCEYTFPSNIISATVTPIFSVSADYAKAKGISYTAVYLKMTPGSNLLGHATEPKYYTWRAKANGDNDPTPYLVGDKNLEREPEGAYGGQKMLYIGNDMYVAYVQSDLYGILFDNGTPQTFDFNEFIKLQKLGYNNITFEPKSSTQSVASTLHNSYNANGVRKYEDSAQQTVEITPDNVNTEFELDVDIEGYYIDVFGNKLIDTDGNAIKRSDFVATLKDTSVSSELSALLTETGASTEIYGARYGYYNRPDSDYGMRYSVYNYYVSGGTSKKLISQQVSGYGTIEGAMSPKNSSKTNAAYQASLLKPDYLTYFDDSTNPTSKKTFNSGYELIPETYKGAPYLVSYKTTSDNRTDGKWYYMNTTPQVTVNVKTSLLNSNGSLNMSSAGKIVENTTPGTATVNYKSFDTIDQGTSAVMRATPNEGFAFVGFYEENGDFISKYNPYGNKVFAVDTTVYAVFKEVADGSVTITNSPYDSALSNPTPGGGTGKISVTLVITPRDPDDEQGNPVYGKPVSYTGETSVSAPIKDGDKFHIILTGERSGADNFLAFRMPDKDFVGNLYYVALDDAQFLNVTKDSKGKAISAIYETEDMVWDWTEQLGTTVTQETKRAKTFSYYTDFSKTDINATLEYRYKDRFGNWKTYIVKNVPMDVSQINAGNYVPDNTLVLKYAPPIDEVFNSCSWKATDIDARNSYALLEADQTYKTFKTYVDRNADGIYSTEEQKVAKFNESIQIDAPETKGNATFKYWKRYLLDSKGDKSGSGEIFSNMRSISIKVTFDSVFEPVYDEVFDTYFTNVQDAKYTREKSTDDKGVVYDYVYADFLLQFDTLEGNDTFKNIVAKNGKIKFGVILEMDYNYTYQPTAEKPGFTAPTTDNDLLKETIKNLNTGLAEGGHNSGWNATNDSGLAQYNYYYNLYDLTDKASNLSNFGRYDYFFKFANTEANRARVYNAYSYIIIYNDNNQIDQIIVSNPKTLSIYATGIKNDGSTSEKIDTTESV